MGVDKAGEHKLVPGVDHISVTARQIDANAFDFSAVDQHVPGLELADRLVARHDVATLEQQFAPRQG